MVAQVLAALVLARTLVGPQHYSHDGTRRGVTDVRLDSISRYGEDYSRDILRIRSVQLQDLKWHHRYKVYYPCLDDLAAAHRYGDKASLEGDDFLLVVDSNLANLLLQNRSAWLHHSVNVHFITTDLGLTANHFVGYVVRIDLLDAEGTVIRSVAN